MNLTLIEKNIFIFSVLSSLKKALCEIKELEGKIKSVSFSATFSGSKFTFVYSSAQRLEWFLWRCPPRELGFWSAEPFGIEDTHLLTCDVLGSDISELLWEGRHTILTSSVFKLDVKAKVRQTHRNKFSLSIPQRFSMRHVLQVGWIRMIWSSLAEFVKLSRVVTNFVSKVLLQKCLSFKFSREIMWQKLFFWLGDVLFLPMPWRIPYIFLCTLP